MATVTVTDSIGQSRERSVAVTVTPSLVVLLSSNASSGSAPLKVSRSAEVSGGTPPYTCEWNFSDGLVSSAQSANQTFGLPEVSSVTFEITEADGFTVHDSVEIKVTSTSPSGLLSDAGLWLAIGAVSGSVAATTFVLWRRRRPRSPVSGPEHRAK